MNITVLASQGNVFADYECIKGFSFKKAAILVNYAFLPVICAGFRLLRDNCTYLSRFECLLPHNTIA